MYWYVCSIFSLGPLYLNKEFRPCIKFSECQCFLNGTIDESNVCEKSYVSNGSCHSQPGCKYGYNGHDCGNCDSNFFVASYDSHGRPKCQGKYKHLLGSKLAFFIY